MSHYTPSTEDVRREYVLSLADVDAYGNRIAEAEVGQVFDHWLDSVKSAVWDEGYRAGNVDGYFETREEKNPYERKS